MNTSLSTITSENTQKKRDKLRHWFTKHETFFLLLCILTAALAGGGICLLLALAGGIWPSWDVLLCATGYPGVILGFLGGIFWLWNGEEEQEGHCWSDDHRKDKK